MAAGCGHLWTVILLCLIGQTAAFGELDERDWEYLGSDVASLHRLKGLDHRFKHQPIRVQHDYKLRTPRESDGHYEALQRHSKWNNWNKGSISYSEPTNNPRDELYNMLKLTDPKLCPGVAGCILEKKKDINSFLENIEMKKSHDTLLFASEISYTYINKVILIMDTKPETLKKANDEYSEDPHFSTKVTMSCLDSSSCAPKVETGTVLKIIGSSSEDGNTLSGYTGTQLASQMTNVQRAALFSIAGNVSSTFRNDFIKVFSRIHDVNVVLETTVQNDHVYQIIDDTGTSVKYQVPKRPVDHSTQYDKQHILIMQDDPVVRDAAKYLYGKNPDVSSVYMLENEKPKLIKGDSEPLTAESRLVLVGHGEKGNDGEMHLGGYKAEKVADIIEHMNIEENQIKTISVVACEVGSDETFRNTLLKELHSRSIETELHLRSSLLQVTHTGQKITAEINPDGFNWKHNDDSKKVVLKLDRNGEVVTQIQPGNRAEAMFTTERNILGKYFKNFWPKKPQRFVPEMYRKIHTDDLEALAWAFFQHREGDEINHPEFKNNEQYIVYDLPRKWDPIKKEYIKEESRGWLNSEEIKNILNQCYELKSGEDILNVITKYARIGGKDDTYLMLNDWIFKVSPDYLYVYPVGKKLNRDETKHILKMQNTIEAQFNKHRYKDIRSGINECQASGYYANYVKESLQGTYKKKNAESALNPKQEAWLSTMFLATMISESARNFRSFPITLMALDLAHNQNTNKAELGLDFLLNNHPMTRGGTWINTKFRGFKGSSKVREIKTENLKELIINEDKVVNAWFSSYNREEIIPDMIKQILLLVYGENKLNTDKTIINNFKESYTKFKTEIRNQPSTSGILGGSHDGLPTLQNIHAAAEVESSLKFSSYYSRSSAVLAEHVHSQLQKTFGEKMQKLHVKPDSVTIRDGEFQCELVFDTNLAEVKKWKFPLPEESKILMEKLKTNVKEVSEMTTIHTTSVHLEEAGKLLGVTGLLLSAQGAVNAFEHGDIKTGVVATLQTIHGVTGMTLAALGQQVTVAAENKAMKAISTGLKNPAFKRSMGIVMPVTGIAFGIYNIAEDLKRGGALGIIDLTLDNLMVDLDIVEFVQPELAPIIIPVNLVLGAIRMTIDNIYLDIEHELKILPSDATVLDKIRAVIIGFGEGVFHTMLDIESFFYTIPYREIENGHRLIKEISDYHEYFSKTEVAGRKAINFAGGTSSWNGGGITFCLSNDSYSEMCMDYFVSADEKMSEKCWRIDTTNTNDIVLGIGESHKLTYTNIQKKILMFIPAGSVTVPSGYEALTYSRYGAYSGNNKKNNFFAVQESKDNHQLEIMLSYYYKLYGKGGSDTFYLGPQRSYVEGQSGKDIYIIPKDGGSTIINNYDPLKATDLLIISINYDQISVTKIDNHVVLQYNNNHYVKILEWFTGEEYRHMNLMSADGVLFDISKVVFSSVKLVARGVNMMSKPKGQTVDTNKYLLLTVTNIVGSPYDDRLIGNSQKNLIDGGGGQDFLMGGEGEDVYVVKNVKDSRVLIENYSRNKEIDILIIEANLHDIKTKVDGNSLILIPFDDDRTVVLRNWFHSEEQRHLLVVTNDLFTFSLSKDKTLCSHSNPIHSKCIQSQIINYSESTRPLVIDLETDEAYLNITELHGSNLNDNIKGNAQGNTIYPRSGSDFLQGRGGQDLYIVTPGHGVKIIDNFSPDMALDTLFFNVNYSLIAVECFDTDLLLLVNGNKEVCLNNWFNSKMSQHLQVQTADGIIFSFQSSKCTENMKLPKSVDYRKSQPGQKMLMNRWEFVSVEKMYGSPGFDLMVGNDNDNWLDPFTGGAFMEGGEGIDTYIVKPEYGIRLEIDNFANDEKVDTVLFQAEFLSTPFRVDGENDDVIISANYKGENMMVKLRNYRAGQKHQHLSFQSADGVHFRVRSPVANQSNVLQDPWIEAFKVILKDKQSDCYIDLSSQKNLSTVYRVQGCSDQSNDIQGNDQDNTLIGGSKNDFLEGGDGHDSLMGGDGNDILIGSRGNDTLYGGDGDDTLLGSIGWDIFVPGLGADVIDGGPGRDTVLYQGDHKKGEGVYVSLLTGEGHQADAEGDVLKDVENLIGTIYSDILVSGYEPALLKGSDGDDVLVSVTAGDYLIGGEGRDIYTVVSHHGLVTIDNCAEDKAMDFLYLPFVTDGFVAFEENSSGVHLNFLLPDSTILDIFLKDWFNNSHKCGHLTVIIKHKHSSGLCHCKFDNILSILEAENKIMCFKGTEE